jgi:hypothetical protein
VVGDCRRGNVSEDREPGGRNVSEAEDQRYVLEQLRSNDAATRARMLRVIAAQPSPDHELLKACERLLEDTEVCLLTIPYSFGEVRWAAADAVAELRGALGMQEPVLLSNTFTPCKTDDVARLARAASIPIKGGVDGVLETLRELVATDHVPRCTITRQGGLKVAPPRYQRR